MHHRSRCSEFFPSNEWIYPSKRLIKFPRRNFYELINSWLLLKSCNYHNTLFLQASSCKLWQIPYFVRFNTPYFDEWLSLYGFDTSNFNKCPTSNRLQHAGFDKCLFSQRSDTSDFDKCPICYGFDILNFEKCPTSNRLQAANFDKYPTSYRFDTPNFDKCPNLYKLQAASVDK